MKPIIVGMALTLGASHAFGTAQQPERLIYHGQTNHMCATPLESFFSNDRPKPKEMTSTSSSLWRGYIGTWQIADGSLKLLSLLRPTGKRDEKTWEMQFWEEEIPMSLVFKDQKTPILAIWYSGVLRIPQGDQLRYVHMGFGSVYEKDWYITIVKGKVKAERIVDNKNGAGATRSDTDLQWVALGGTDSVCDDLKWHDARLIKTPAFHDIMASGNVFVTRGIFFKAKEAAPAHLWIPDTPTTEQEDLPLHALPDGHAGGEGSHVEIRAHFVQSLSGVLLHVDAIRELKPGETIHHPDFKPPKKSVDGKQVDEERQR